MKKYIVCLCFGREKCEMITKETAERNNADAYEIEPVAAPFHYEPAYKGMIIFNGE